VENEEAPGITQSVFNITGLYQRIVAAPRNPIPRYTVILEINPVKDRTVVSLNDICDQREMMTRLLKSLAKALPKVIVLDKYYAPHTPRPCPMDPNLVQAIQDLRRNNIPVIVGRRSSDESVGEGSDARYFLTPSIIFEDPDPCLETSNTRKLPCREGVINIDPDTRKLPLEWMLYEGKEEAKKGQGRDWHDTLALSAARAYDDMLLTRHPRLAEFVNVAEHPYISFLRQDDFEAILVNQILTANTSVGANDGSYTGEKLSAELRKMSGKIVVIGEINKDLDDHPSVLGRMSGVYLQANYIEALLDDRYYKPVPILDYVLGFMILAVLELILIVFRNQLWKMALLIVALFGLALVIVYLFIKLPGWYVNPVPVGATAVVIKVLHSLFGPAERQV